MPFPLRLLIATVLFGSFAPSRAAPATALAGCAPPGPAAASSGASRPADWPLALPRRAFARTADDLRGSLIRLGDRVVQIDRMQWQRTPDGTLMPAWIQGFDPEARSVRLSWPRPGALEASLPTALPAPTLRLPGRSIVVIEATLGTDREGFLVFRELTGTDRSSGQTAFLRDLRVPTIFPCGLAQWQSCESRGCAVGGCGDAPACTCSGGIGGCDPISRTWCEGTCEPGFRCNTSVNDCRCESESLPPGDGADTTIGKPKAVDLQGREPSTEPPDADD